jgi:hypothetical protein
MLSDHLLGVFLYVWEREVRQSRIRHFHFALVEGVEHQRYLRIGEG